MLVVPEKRKVVVNTQNHAAIVSAIPHAKTFMHQGQVLTALEHGVEETLVLRNLGFKKAPSPILSYYKWPARFKAMEHQKQTSAFFISNRKALCLNAPGTGKSMSALWAADFLLQEGLIKKVLIIAPLSTLKVVWGKELRHHLPHRSFELLTGSKERRVEKIRTPGVEFLIVNHDGFGIIEQYLGDVDLVIYDEVTALKTPGSQRFKKFFRWSMERPLWLWCLTGTPIAQSPVDAWALARLVGSSSVPRSFTAFKDLVMHKVSTFRWIPKPEANDICMRVLQPSIRFSLDECKDLPDTVFLEHECPMMPEQIKAFKEMKERAVLLSHDISAPNMAVALSKLLQICCGVVYGNDGDRVALDFTGRYDTLKEVLDEIGDKTIVFVPLRGIQERLFDMLKADGYDVAIVNGEVTGAARNKIFEDFQNSDRIKVLLAHPKVAAHGLTLTRAKDIIWYAPIYSLESYEQANARIRRLSTEGKTRVHHLHGTSFERELYSRLVSKKRVLEDFLSLVKGVNE
jgi:SNF2 family DNA or RNA helicase